MGIYSNAKEWADHIVTWAALLTLLATGFAWLSSKVPLVNGLGWAGFSLIGVAMACIVTLSLAGMLSAWRFFNPLAAPGKAIVPTAKEILPRDDSASRRDTDKEFEAIWKDIEAQSERQDAALTDINRGLIAMMVEAQKLVTSQLEALNETDTKLMAAVYDTAHKIKALSNEFDNKLEEARVRTSQHFEFINARADQIERSVAQTRNVLVPTQTFIERQHDLLLIDYLISRYPGCPLTNPEIEDSGQRTQRMAQLNSYLHASRDSLQSTSMDFILKDDLNECETSVDSQIDAGVNLPNLNTIPLRNYLILEAKASRVLTGLRTERVAIENGLRQRRNSTFELFDKWRRRAD